MGSTYNLDNSKKRCLQLATIAVVVRPTVYRYTSESSKPIATCKLPLTNRPFLSSRQYKVRSMAIWVALLSLIQPIHALDTPGVVSIPRLTTSHVVLPGIVGAYVLIWTTCPGLLGTLMGAFALAWPIIKHDPRSSATLQWAVYALWGLFTAAYCYVSFSQHKLGRGSLLVTLLLAAFSIALYSSLQTNGVDAVLTSIPPILSLCVFTVASAPAIGLHLEQCFRGAVGTLATLGRLERQRDIVDQADLESGILLYDRRNA